MGTMGNKRDGQDFASLLERVANTMRNQIVIDPEIMDGAPVIRGTRIPVFVILDYLADGCTINEIIEDFPSLSPEKIKDAIAFASQVITPRSEV